MISAKMATPGLPKIPVFSKKGHEDIILSLTSPTKILSHNSNYIADVFMWPKFGNCNISMREVYTSSFL